MPGMQGGYTLMDLNRPQVDVGIFTNRINEMKAFYTETLGLQFESVLPVGDAFMQHRFVANGSIIKLMEARDLLPRRHPGGYESLIIASNRLSAAGGASTIPTATRSSSCRPAATT